MPDMEKVIENLEKAKTIIEKWIPMFEQYNTPAGIDCAIALLKEQEAEIRQLRLALDIAKGTCKGIKSGGGQFADMPTMQSAT